MTGPFSTMCWLIPSTFSQFFFFFICFWHLLRLKELFSLWLCTPWISSEFSIAFLSHLHSPITRFKKLNTNTEVAEFRRALLENSSFVEQLTARSAAGVKQMGHNFREGTLPWAIFSPLQFLFWSSRGLWNYALALRIFHHNNENLRQMDSAPDAPKVGISYTPNNCSLLLVIYVFLCVITVTWPKTLLSLTLLTSSAPLCTSVIHIFSHLFWTARLWLHQQPKLNTLRFSAAIKH